MAFQADPCLYRLQVWLWWTQMRLLFHVTNITHRVVALRGPLGVWRAVSHPIRDLTVLETTLGHVRFWSTNYRKVLLKSSKSSRGVLVALRLESSSEIWPIWILIWIPTGESHPLLKLGISQIMPGKVAQVVWNLKELLWQKTVWLTSMSSCFFLLWGHRSYMYTFSKLLFLSHICLNQLEVV